MGCASSKFELMDAKEQPALKGKTIAEVTEKLGEPNQRYTDSSGDQVWEYKKPAASKAGLNAMGAIGSFGFGSGSDSMYVDILRLTFHNGSVKKYGYDEAVLGIALPAVLSRQLEK